MIFHDESALSQKNAQQKMLTKAIVVRHQTNSLFVEYISLFSGANGHRKYGVSLQNLNWLEC